MKTFLFLLIDVLSQFIGAIGYILITFLIWQQGNDLSKIIEFNLKILVVLIPLSVLAGGFIKILGIKTVFLLSLVFRVVTYALVLEGKESSYITFFIAAYSALSFSTRPLLTQALVDTDKLVNFSAKRQILTSILSILSPILTAIMIENFGYESSLKSCMYTLGIVAILFICLPVKKFKQTFNILKLAYLFINSQKLRAIARVNFGVGVTLSLSWGVMDIFTLDSLGSLQNWSTIKVGIAFIVVLISIYLRQIGAKEVSKMRAIIGISSILFATIPIFLINNSSFEIFVLLIIAQSVYSAISNILTLNLVNSAENDFENFENEKLTYQIFNDFFINVGQVLPIAFIYFILSDQINRESLVWLIVVITLIPVLFLGNLRKISSFSTY